MGILLCKAYRDDAILEGLKANSVYSYSQGHHANPGLTLNPAGAEYIAACLPAFSPSTVHRDPE